MLGRRGRRNLSSAPTGHPWKPSDDVSTETKRSNVVVGGSLILFVVAVAGYTMYQMSKLGQRGLGDEFDKKKGEAKKN